MIAFGVAAVAILLILLVFSVASRNIDTNMPRISGTSHNESFTPVANTYVSLLYTDDVCTINQVWNTSNNIPVSSANYTQDGCSLNITCDLGEMCFVNSTTLVVDYDYKNDTAEINTFDLARATGLNSFGLASIALIVFVAIVIIGIVSLVGRR
jgi:hypothetical protein